MPVACSQNNGFKMRPEDLDAAITPRTKWLILNSPSNPSGAAYTERDLREIADVLLKHEHVWVMTDDMYEHLIYDDFEYRTIAQVEPRLYDRTLTVNGVSKAYCMTGWRIGYAGGPKQLIKAMGAIQSNSTANPCSISQAAAIEALTGPQDFIPKNAKVFKERRDLVVDLLNKVPGLHCPRPEGAFYAFLRVDGVSDSLAFAKKALFQSKVGLAPGSAFGPMGEGYLRLCFARAPQLIREAVERLRPLLD